MNRVLPIHSVCFSALLPLTVLDTVTPSVHISLLRALAGGAVAAGLVAALLFAVGHVSAWEAEVLLGATLPTTRFLCSAVMTVSATILALMLTVIGISRGAEQPIEAAFYRRIQQVALLDVITFVASTILLLTLVVPFGEDLKMPQGWYVTIYYIVSVGSSVVGGLLIAVVLMLYGAVHDVVKLFWGDDDSPALDREALEEREAEQARQEAERAEEKAEEAEEEAEHAEEEADRAEEEADRAAAG